MTININIDSAFCTFADWHLHLPTEFQSLGEAAWLAKSRRGDWAAYTKTLGERSQAYWRKDEITAWFKSQFGEVYPECVEALIAAGFEQQPIKSKTRKVSDA